MNPLSHHVQTQPPFGTEEWLDFALTDAHCHTVSAAVADTSSFEQLLTESDRAPARGTSYADTPLGLAVRRWCAAPLGLPTGAAIEEYLARRAELGENEVRRRLLTTAGLSRLCVDTGIGGERTVPLGALEVAGARAHEVVRLETVAEQLAAEEPSAQDFAGAFARRLVTATEHAVAVKSILAYRHGLDVLATRPTEQQVMEAADRWLRSGGGRLVDPVLLRLLLWSAVDLGLPIQLHTGFGDPDLRLRSADPGLLQPFIEAAEPSGTPILLLHCYPYHRSAGYLAAMYPTVYADVGLTLSHVGARAPAVLGEFLELAPFGKLVFSTDAYGLPELYAVGASQFRWALGQVLDEWVAQSACTSRDAARIARLIGHENADRMLPAD